MASAVAAVVTALGATKAVATVIGAIASIGFSFISKSIFGKKKQPELSSFNQETSRTVNVREPIVYREIVYGVVRKGGPIAYLGSFDRNYWVGKAILIAGHECEDIVEVYADGRLIDRYEENDGVRRTQPEDHTTVPSADTLDVWPLLEGLTYNDPTEKQNYLDEDAVDGFENRMFWTKHLGTDDQASDSQMVSAFSDWTTSHRFRGISYVFTEQRYNDDIFPQDPQFSFTVMGKKLYDVRTGVTEWSMNPALCIYDYLTNSDYGLGASTDEIDSASFITAANICDEQVAKVGGGSEPRYTCNGVISTKDKPSDIIEGLLSSCGGLLTYSSGVFSLKVAAYTSSVESFTEADFMGPLTLITRTSIRDRFNTVKGVYTSPLNDWQPADFPKVTNATYVSEDNGEEIIKDIDLPFTISSSTAQRLAKIELEKGRREMVISFTTGLKGMRLIAGDIISVTYDRFGFSSSEFEVIDWTLSAANNSGAPIVEVTAKEIDSAAYDWLPGNETTITRAVNNSLPDPTTVSAPTGLTAASGTDHLRILKDGTIDSRVFLNWTQPDDAYVVNGGFIQVQFKKSADADWIDVSSVKGDSDFSYINSLEDGTAYDFRIRSVNYLNFKSSWVTVSNHTVVGKTAAPSNVTNFIVIQQTSDLVTFKWDQVTDLDLSGYEIRFGQTGDTWGSMTVITVAKKGTVETSATIPSGATKFAIKAVDTSGNYSTTAAFFQLTLFNTYSAIDVIFEDSSFAGTLVNFTESGGKLVPDAGASTSTYTSAEIDLTANTDARVWGIIKKNLESGETGTANAQFKLFWRKDGEPTAADQANNTLINPDSTFTNCHLHHLGYVIPNDQNTAGSYGYELFDKTVPTPETSCTYELPEHDFGADKTVGVNVTYNFKSGVGSSDGDVSFQIDYKTAAGSYDGFEEWESGQITGRYLKQKFVFDNTEGAAVLTSASVEYDSFQDWTVGVVNARYLQARLVVDNTIGRTEIDNYTVQAEQA